MDYYWERLLAGEGKSQCGWLKDQFGVSWQVVPSVLFEPMSDPDAKKSARVMRAVLTMKKLDIPTLQAASAAAD